MPVAEISKQLDFATRENMRLKQAVEENNHFLEQKLQEFVLTQSMLTQSMLGVRNDTTFLFYADQSPQVRSECNNM